MFAKALAAVARSGVRAVAAPSSHSVAPAAVRCFSMVTVPFDGNDPDFVVSLERQHRQPSKCVQSLTPGPLASPCCRSFHVKRRAPTTT